MINTGPGTANHWPRRKYISWRQRTRTVPQGNWGTRSKIGRPTGQLSGIKRRRDDGQQDARGARKRPARSSRIDILWPIWSAGQQHGININGIRRCNNKRIRNQTWDTSNTREMIQKTTTNHQPQHRDTIRATDLWGNTNMFKNKGTAP